MHVCREMCATCVFRPGNLMELRPGRLKELVDVAVRDESAIICHETLEVDRAVCRGFFDRHKTQPLQVAERFGLLVEADVQKPAWEQGKRVHGFWIGTHRVGHVGLMQGKLPRRGGYFWECCGQEGREDTLRRAKTAVARAYKERQEINGLRGPSD